MKKYEMRLNGRVAETCEIRNGMAVIRLADGTIKFSGAAGDGVVTRFVKRDAEPRR